MAVGRMETDREEEILRQQIMSYFVKVSYFKLVLKYDKYDTDKLLSQYVPLR